MSSQSTYSRSNCFFGLTRHHPPWLRITSVQFPGMSDCAAKNQPSDQVSSLSKNAQTQRVGCKSFVELELAKYVQFIDEAILGLGHEQFNPLTMINQPPWSIRFI